MTCGDHLGIHRWSPSTGVVLEDSSVRPLGCIAYLHNSAGFLGAAKWATQVIRLQDGPLTATWGVMQPGTDREISSIRISLDDRFVLTAAHSGVAQLSSTTDGSTFMRLGHGTSPLTCAEFSPDDRAIVTAAEDGTVRIWPVDVVGVARLHVPATPDIWPREMPGEVAGK